MKIEAKNGYKFYIGQYLFISTEKRSLFLHTYSFHILIFRGNSCFSRLELGMFSTSDPDKTLFYRVRVSPQRTRPIREYL